MRKDLVALFASALLLASTLSATDRFVSMLRGSDGNNGSAKSPFKTIARGLAASKSGDRVIVLPGRYAPSTGERFPLVIPPRVSLLGTETRSCLIDGEGKQALLVRVQSNGVFRGFSLRSGRTGWWDMAVLVQDVSTGNASKVEVDHLRLDGVPRGIVVGSPSGTHSLSGVQIHDVTITRCLVEGINSWTGGGKASGNRIWNCTIHGHRDPGNPGRSVMRAAISFAPGAQFDVRNCILAFYDWAGIEASGKGGLPPAVTSDSNLFWSFKGNPVTSSLKLGPKDRTKTDPLLAGAPGPSSPGDLHLTTSRSPCFQGGVNQPGQSAHFDMDWRSPRIFAGVVDIGADEYQGIDAWFSGPPLLSSKLRLGMVGAPQAPALFVLGFSTLPSGVKIPGFGGRLHLDPGKPLLFAAASKNSKGYAALTLPLPNLPSLAGTVLYLQAVETPSLTLTDLDLCTLIR